MTELEELEEMFIPPGSPRFGARLRPWQKKYASKKEKIAAKNRRHRERMKSDAEYADHYRHMARLRDNKRYQSDLEYIEARRRSAREYKARIRNGRDRAA